MGGLRRRPHRHVRLQLLVDVVDISERVDVVSLHSNLDYSFFGVMDLACQPRCFHVAVLFVAIWMVFLVVVARTPRLQIWIGPTVICSVLQIVDP